MDGQGERYGKAEAEAVAQVLERLEQTASKLDEIFQLLQEAGRVEAMMARFEQFISGRLPVTVLDSSVGGPDEECGVTMPPHGT